MELRKLFGFILTFDSILCTTAYGLNVLAICYLGGLSSTTSISENIHPAGFGPSQNGRVKRYSIRNKDVLKWTKRKITYHFVNFSDKMDASQTRVEFARAADEWSRHSGLALTEVHTDKADILLSFATRRHGDTFVDPPFDGPSGSLAHAFPPDGREIGGDIHFDDDERWAVNASVDDESLTDFYSVALHELGHSLGLSHSQETPSVMSAEYGERRRSNVAGGLQPDDVDGIRTLYAEYATSRPPVQPPKRKPPSENITTTVSSYRTDPTITTIEPSTPTDTYTETTRQSTTTDRGQTTTGTTTWNQTEPTTTRKITHTDPTTAPPTKTTQTEQTTVSTNSRNNTELPTTTMTLIKDSDTTTTTATMGSRTNTSRVKFAEKPSGKDQNKINEEKKSGGTVMTSEEPWGVHETPAPPTLDPPQPDAAPGLVPSTTLWAILYIVYMSNAVLKF